jgi:hypothetical protein
MTSNVGTGSSHLALPPQWGLGLLGSLCPDAFQQHRSRLIFPAFTPSQFSFGGDEFATEGSGKDGLGQHVSAERGIRDSLFDSAGQSEEGVNTLNDFFLLVK